MLNLTKNFIQDLHSQFSLFPCDNEWRHEPNRILSAPEKQQTFVKRSFEHSLAPLDGLLFGFSIFDQLYSNHQPQPTDITDDKVPV
jgi:hypothetical protein